MGHKKTHLSVFQSPLPFRSVLPPRVAALPFVFEKRILFVLGGFLIILAFLYSYFVMTSVSSVAMRQDIEYENEQLSGSVARLEREYLAAVGTLTEHTAQERGFGRTSKQTFLDRASSSAVAQAKVR